MNDTKNSACINDLSKLKRISNMDLEQDSVHYITLSRLFRWMQMVAVGHVTGIMLDYGCGGQPYRSLLSPYLSQYIGADVAQTPGVHLDLRLSVNAPLPFRSDSIDSVLSTQVLEHVPNPDLYLSEASRVLKKDGTLILTAPMQWRHHEAPFDYYRFTKYGLCYLLERNGFFVLRMDPCGGAFALMGQIFINYLHEKAVSCRTSFYRLINEFSLWLDKRFPDENDTLMWQCIAKRDDR